MNRIKEAQATALRNDPVEDVDTVGEDTRKWTTVDKARIQRLQGGEIHQIAYSDTRGCASPHLCLRIDDISPQELGSEGERIAARYLRDRGWEIVERNWKCPYGEADIIAYDDCECVFVEVKTRLVRSEREQVFPELAVDEAKQRRYVRMAEYYMAMHDIVRVRFDVIAIVVVAHRTAKLHHVVDAFGRDHL